MEHGTLPGNVGLQIIGDLLHAVRFRAGGQQKLAKFQIGDRLGEAEAQLAIGGVGFTDIIVRLETAKLGKTVKSPLLRFLGNRLEVVVIEEINGAAKKGAFIVQQQDFKTPASLGEDIQTAIGILFQHSFHRRGAAGIDDALLAGLYYPEFLALAHYLSEHLLVPVFKNMKWQRSAGKEHQGQWEQRQQFLLHVYYYGFYSKAMLKRRRTGGAQRGFLAVRGRCLRKRTQYRNE